MGQLILSDGNDFAPHGQDVRRLEDGIAQKAFRHVGQVEFGHLLLEGGVALKPVDGSYHGKEEVEFGHLRNGGLHEKGGALGIHAGGEPVQENLADVLPHPPGVLVTGGQGMPVGHREVAVVFILKPDPVGQDSEPVSEVKLARRAHPAHDAFQDFFPS